jgi:hypothetical protein
MSYSSHMPFALSLSPYTYYLAAVPSVNMIVKQGAGFEYRLYLVKFF